MVNSKVTECDMEEVSRLLKQVHLNHDQQNLSIFNFSNSKDLIRKQPTICYHRPLPYQFQKLQNLTQVG